MVDSTILITGGASGIGAAIVRTALDEFENVFFSDIQDDLGEELAAETGASGREMFAPEGTPGGGQPSRRLC